MPLKTYKPKETTTIFNLYNNSSFFRQWEEGTNSGVPPEIKLHPVIKDLFRDTSADISPHALLKLPHIDPTEGADIAYCRMRQKSYEGYDADTDKFVNVKLGKMLRQVFPTLPQIVITRTVEKYTALQAFNLRFTQSDQELKEIMLWMTTNYKENPTPEDVVIPSSCMSNPTYIKELVKVDVHPYQAYAHALGWSLAYMPIDPEDYTKGILARAIVHDDGSGNKKFVRTYAASREYQTSERLEHLLNDSGYTAIDDWSGYSIAKIECEELGVYGEIVAPYIDGAAEYLEDSGKRIEDMWTLQIRYDSSKLDYDSAAYPADCANGTPEILYRCDHCHDPYAAGNLYTVGRNEDTDVCEYCRAEHYEYIESRGLWVPADEVVKLYDGDYALVEDAVYIDRYDEHALTTEVVYSEEGDEWIPRHEAIELHNGDWTWEDNCWRDHMGNWHSDKEPHVEDPETGEMYTEEEYEAMQRTDKEPHVEDLEVRERIGEEQAIESKLALLSTQFKSIFNQELT